MGGGVIQLLPSPCEVSGFDQSWHVLCLFSSPCEVRSAKKSVFRRFEDRVPGQQVNSSWSPVAPVHKLLTIMTRVLEVSHCARKVSLVGLQGDQPIHGSPHILLCLRVVLQQGCTGHGPIDSGIDIALRDAKLCLIDPLHTISQKNMEDLVV